MAFDMFITAKGDTVNIQNKWFKHKSIGHLRPAVPPAKYSTETDIFSEKTSLNLHPG